MELVLFIYNNRGGKLKMEEKTFLYECSWCGILHNCKIQGEKQENCSCKEGYCKDNVSNAEISHSICKDCFEKELKKMEKLIRAKEGK